ncbi:MAG: hypothetical protein IT279_14635 [Ignavibacteriaceae bacterium]|nr:hypothetical protein [Ignavibacteriaceae bacterium]
MSKNPFAFILLISYALLVTYSAFHYHSVRLGTPQAIESTKNPSGHSNLYSDIANCQLPRIIQNLSVYYAPAQESLHPQVLTDDQKLEFQTHSVHSLTQSTASLRAPPKLS